MDWHWNTGIKWSSLFSSVEIHNSTSTTQSKSYREEYGAVRRDQVIDEYRKNNSTILKICQLRWRRTSSMLRIGRLKNGYQFMQKVEDKRKGFNIAWIRAILINSCTFEQFKEIQEIMLLILHCKTMYCRRQRKRIEVNSEPWCDSREESVSEWADKLCSSQLWIRWIIKMVWVKPYATCQKQDLRHTKILGNTFRIQYVGAIWSSLTKRGLQFYQTRSNVVILFDTLPAEFTEKAVCMKTKDQLYQRDSVILRPRVVLRGDSQGG